MKNWIKNESYKTLILILCAIIFALIVLGSNPENTGPEYNGSTHSGEW